MKYYFLLCFLLLVLNSPAQTALGDSLQSELSKEHPDTVRLKLLNDLSWELSKNGNIEKAIELGKEALSLSSKKMAGLDRIQSESFKNEMAISYNNLGVYYRYKGDFDIAVKYHFKSLEIQLAKDDQPEIAKTYNNIGIVHASKGEYDRALGFFLKSIHIKENLNDRKGMLYSYGNIAIIYSRKGDLEKALFYHKKGLKICEEDGDRRIMAVFYNNIGSVFFKKKNFDKSLDCFLKAKEINEEFNDTLNAAYANILMNTGIIYKGKGDASKSFTEKDAYYDKSFHNLNKSLNIHVSNGAKQGMAITYNNLGNLFLNKKLVEKARQFQEKSLALALETAAKPDLVNAFRSLSECDSALGNFKGAYQFYKQFTSIKDSILNEDIDKKIVQAEMNFEFEKKQHIVKAEQEKKNALSKEALKRQKVISWSVTAGGGLLLLLAFGAIRGYRLKRMANMLLEEKNQIIEEKNKDITDSINYAKNIQQAILPFESRMKKALPEHFVFFKPKDIVSGDFYWFMEKGEKIFLAVIDCTGHGVPGAFMSMIGSAILNHIVGEQNITQADLILNEMHRQVRTALKQEENNNKDGMDLVLCVIDKKKMLLEFAGAMNPLYVIMNGTLETIKGDKYAIGGSQDEAERKFILHSLAIEERMTIFLSTDGFADQFGGPGGKKFKYSKFRELLLTIANDPMDKQKEILDNSFEQWKGNLEQVDDVCVIGVKF